MRYQVKEIYYTLQGEGANVGRAAVFLRFAGCNLWSGREADRGHGGSCSAWCDTDFLGTDGQGGARFADAASLADAVVATWPAASTASRFIVCTGGEPLLQLDDSLVKALHEAGFEIAIETNGTLVPPAGIDWICVSPKAGADVVLKHGDELKFIFPQPGFEPAQLEQLDFRHFFLQPMDGPELERNTKLALAYCLAHPRWRLSLQTHKILHIP